MISEAKEHLLSTLKSADRKWFYMYTHIPQVEKWAIKIAKLLSGANMEILLTSVWLHDIGLLLGSEGDHAVNSEAEVLKFLTGLGASPEVISQVSHCVRAHRCKDVLPQSIEEKILAVADSASHMTDDTYACFAARGELQTAKEKLERDFHDVGLILQVKAEVTPLYLAWKHLLEVYPS